ncbi:hypothetical protein FQN50_006306 [Emmonsiellopsis sp. PD_5]|nr:hypothetical protein FQN50_006306 [Emmonsiellopsis sp. PD_5]
MPPKRRDDFKVAIICALALEAEAVEALFDEIYDRSGMIYGKQPGDTNLYITGRIGKHDIVLCCMPEMGKVSAASVSSALTISYPGIRLALVVGICGGAPSPSSDQQIFLGDVIISDAVVGYDFGRQFPDGFRRKTAVKDILGRPNREIRSLMTGLRMAGTRRELREQMLRNLRRIQGSEAKWQPPGSAEDILFEASYHHKHYNEGSPVTCCSDQDINICDEALKQDCSRLGCDKNRVTRRRDGRVADAAIHTGTIASANTVMKSGEHRDRIVREKNVIGFEMEAAGVWDNVSCIIVKGVCDYADSHKSKLWQAYAAATGASAAKAFLEFWGPNCEGAREPERHWMVPFLRNSQFVGRTNEIERVEDLILQPDGPAKIAISGLGGVGKTQVVLELAYRMRHKDAGLSIFWIPCTNYESVEQAYSSIASAIGIQRVEVAKAKEQVRDHLQKTAWKWLLIFDNADDMDMWIKGSDTNPALKNFLPRNEQGRIIFTSRNRKLATKLAGRHVVPIDKLDEQTGVQFLKRSLIDSDLVDDMDTTIALLEQLTFLPLAIAQAAAYINENSTGLADYLELLQGQESNVVKILSEDFEDEGRYGSLQNPVVSTWLISFEQIQRLNELAANYLSLMACINPRDIPRSLLPQSTSKKESLDAIGLLKAYSFIAEQDKSGLLALHRLVRLATRNWLRKEDQFTQWISKTADRLNETFPDADHEHRKLWREYLPHVLSLIGEHQFQTQQDKYTELLHKVATCIYLDGRYNEAAVMFENIVSIRVREYGTMNHFTLGSMSNLALIYSSQGQWKKAEELGIQTLEIKKQVLGLEHPDTLITMSNLVLTYNKQGQWEKAEELGMQVLEIRKQVLSLEHPNTLTSMSNLAFTYNRQGQQKKAEELEMQVLEIKKQVLGPEHPNTLTSMSNLASTYNYQGQWKKAEELGMQVLEIKKQVLGPEHPDTLVSMSNLAFTYNRQGQWKKAEELGMQVLEITKQVLGPEHPNTLVSMSNQASTYHSQGQWKKAEELGIQVLEITKQVLGPEHPHILTSMHNLACTWHSLGKVNDALILMKECAQLRSKHLGPDHPRTLSSSAFFSDWQHANNSSPNKPLLSAQPEKDQNAPDTSEPLATMSLASRSADERTTEQSESGSKTTKHRNRLGLKRLFRRS